MFLRILVVLFWIFTLLQPASAQNWRRKKTEAQGWVWVSHTIDPAQLPGGEDSIMTLDGEPLSTTRESRVTLGLVIDNEGHVVTRLVDVTPAKPPINASIRAQGAKPAPAKFLGMDTVTGLCVLKVEGASLAAPTFSDSSALPRQLYIRLYGFHPKLNQNTSLSTSLYPQCDAYPGLIAKAVDDFRFNAGNPIYNLLTPQLTPVQDCSLILDKDDSIFGVAIYSIGGDGKHLVYPVSRLQTIAQSVIKSHASIAYGWLGADGQDAAPTAPSRAISDRAPSESGVRILNIAPDGPAEKAGVKPQDVVVAVNDYKVSTRAQMVSMMRQISPDNEVALKVKRGDEYKLLRAKLIPAPAIEPEQQLVAFNRKLDDIEKELKLLAPTDPTRPHLESSKNAWLRFVNGLVDGIWSQAQPDVRLRVLYGFETQALTGQLMSYFAVTGGLLVSSVSENTVAAQSGLRAGDVIVEAGAKPLNRLADLIDALDAAAGAPIEITVARRRERVKLTFSDDPRRRN